MNRFHTAFGALVLAQSLHSIEEYVGRLERGFIVANVALVAFGLWCWWWPVRRGWPSAVPLAWAWVAIETINGIGHPLWTLRLAGYTPGVGTAPILLALAIYLANQLWQVERHAPGAA
jgi:hypothetical protein